jgi:outer membrane protease
MLKAKIQSFLFASLPVFCFASSGWVPDVSKEGYFGSIDLNPYVGVLFGMNREFVFNKTDPTSHYKESQLDWKVSNLSVLGWKFQLNCIADRLHFFYNGWAYLNSKTSTMVDRDWSNSAQKGPTDFSWTGAALTKAFKLMGEIDYDFYAAFFNCHDLKFGLLMGYQFLDLHWDDHAGGTYSYDNGTSQGTTAPGDATIFFEQQFSIPYLGLQINLLEKKCWGLRSFGKYSWFTSAKDLDLHSGTGEFSVDKYGGNWWAVGADLHWYFWKELGFNLTYTFEKMGLTKGSAKDSGSDGTFYTSAASGISYYQNEFTFGFKASF